MEGGASPFLDDTSQILILTLDQGVLFVIHWHCSKSWVYKIISTQHFRLFTYLKTDFIDWHGFSVYSIPKEILMNITYGPLFKISH